MSAPIDDRPDGPDSPDSIGWVRPHTAVLTAADAPFRLHSGAEISAVTVEFETYGQLNAAGDNAILICHALTGDA
ncbi:MAG: homoserine O-acetyltransferase, partial [Planctomycetota bacterium]